MQNNNPLIHPAYTDAVFKYLMFDDNIRNAFLSRILKTEVLSSKMMDPALAPFDDLHETRALIKELMKKESVQKLERLSKTVTEADRLLLNKILQCLSFVYELFPDKDRFTTLDIVCSTADRIINTEIQVSSQFFWDLRMLVHGGGLVFKQILKGLRWEEISPYGQTSNKHGEEAPAFRETIVIGLLVTTPVARPAETISFMPWYEITKWKNDEVRRVFHLSEETNPSIRMPGLTFHQYNLSAVAEKLAKEDMGDNRQLLQWLDLFGPSREKRLHDVEYLQAEEPALWKAYEILTHLPKKIAKASEKELKMYHITQQEKDMCTLIGLEKGEARGEARGREEKEREIALNLMSLRVPASVIAKSVGRDEAWVLNLQAQKE